MKGITDFVASLLPDFKKDTVNEQCRLALQQLERNVLPVYKQADNAFIAHKFVSDEAKSLQSTARNVMKGVGSKNFISFIYHELPGAIRNIQMLEERVESDFNDDIVSKGMTFRQATAMRLIEIASFIGDYLPRLLNYIFVVETRTIQKEEDAVGEDLTKAEVDFVEAKFLPFCQAFNALTGNPDGTKEVFEKIPDVVITPTNERNMQSTVGQAKLDPFKLGFISARYNPIFYIRMNIAERQAESYRKAVDQRRQLQFRLLAMQHAARGKQDPAVQKELAVMTERVEKLEYKIAKMEKDYA